MQLTLATHPVTEIRFGTPTRLEDTTLYADTEELRQILLEDNCLRKVEFEIVGPGESCRAGPVFDIIEPRAKAGGASHDCPGIWGTRRRAGVGRSSILGRTAGTGLRAKT